MADPITDVSLDPFQVQEDALNQQYKDALARKLRAQEALMQGPTGGWASVPGQAYAGGLVGQADNAMKDIEGRRKALSDQYQASVDEASANAPPEIKAMIHSPATRGAGLDLYKQYQQSNLDAQEMARMRAAHQSALPQTQQAMGPPGPSSDQGPSALPQSVSAAQGGGYGDDLSLARDMSLSSNPRVAAKGKQMLENLKPTDPTHTTYIDNSGNVRVLPGATAALEQTEKARTAGSPEWETVTPYQMADGSQVPMSRRQHVQMTNLMQNGLSESDAVNVVRTGKMAMPGQGQTPGPVPGPAPGPAPGMPSGAPQRPPQSQGGVDPLLQHIPTLEGFDPNNPNAVSPKGAQGQFQIMPANIQEYSRRAGRQLDPNNPADGAQMANAILTEARNRYSNLPPDKQDAAVLAYYNGGPKQGDAVAAGKNAPSQETQAYLYRYMQLKAGQQPDAPPPAQQQAAKTDPMSYLDPSLQLKPPSGAYFNPTQNELYKNRQMKLDDDIQKNEDGHAATTQFYQKAVRLKELLADPNSYYAGRAAMTASQLEAAFNSNDPKLANTAQIEKLVADMQADRTRAISNRATNMDLKVAQAAVPDLSKGANAARQVTDQLLSLGKDDMDKEDFVANAARQGYPLDVAARAWTRAWEARRAANPTSPAASQPPAAAGVALPQSKAAAGGGSWLDTIAQTGKNIGGFLTDPDSWKGMATSALPTAVNAASEAIVSRNKAGDLTWGALPRAIAEQGAGIAGLAGIGRDTGMDIRRSNEQYAAESPEHQDAMRMWGIGNPVNAAIMSTGAGPAARVLQGAAMSARPEESWVDQAKNAAIGAGVNLAVPGAVNALVPAGRVATKIGGQATEAVLDEFPSLKRSLTSAQVEGTGAAPKFSNQAQALTDDLQKAAGLETGPITSQKIQAGYDALGKEFDTMFPRGGKPVLVDTRDLGGLKDAIEAMPKQASESPAFRKVYQALSDAEAVAQRTGNPIKIKLDPGDIQDMYRQVSMTAGPGASEAAGTLRQEVKNVIGKMIPDKSLPAFENLNTRFGNLKDLERAYDNGSGLAPGSQHLSPNSIASAARGSPDPTGSFVKANELMKYFKVGQESNVLDTLWSAVKNKGVAAAKFLGGIQNPWNVVGTDAANVADVLRKGAPTATTLTTRELQQE